MISTMLELDTKYFADKGLEHENEAANLLVLRMKKKNKRYIIVHLSSLSRPSGNSKRLDRTSPVKCYSFRSSSDASPLLLASCLHLSSNFDFALYQLQKNMCWGSGYQ